MADSSRPELTLWKLATYAALLGLGSVIFSLTFSPDHYSILSGPAMAPTAKIGELALQDFVLSKAAAPGRMLCGLLASALITVSLYEMLKLATEFLLWHFSRRHDLEAFFGEGAASRSNEAEVQVQSDSIDDIMGDIADVKASIERNSKHRLYKARSWLNRFDTDSARYVIRLFREEKLPPPTLKPVSRHDPFKHPKGPFVVLLGLGHTAAANNLIGNRCGSWLRVEHTDNGDTLLIHHRLVPSTMDDWLQVSNSPDNPDFRRLTPKDWSLGAWLAGSKQVRDYAVILRHTEPAGNGATGCVYFWLAGFTERGTAAAGRFFMQNWGDGLNLYKKFVERRETRSVSNGFGLFGSNAQGAGMGLGRDTAGAGDFLVILEGPSQDDEASQDQWSLIRDFEVTPDKMVQLYGKQPEPAFMESHWGQRELTRQSGHKASARSDPPVRQN